MGADALQAASEAARRFTVRIGEEVEMQCLLPTRLEERLVARDALVGGDLNTLRMNHALLTAGVIGWSGVRECHLVAGASRDPLGFDAATLRLALAERTDWFDRLAGEFARRLNERRERFEADEGNSSSVSPGS